MPRTLPGLEQLQSDLAKYVPKVFKYLQPYWTLGIISAIVTFLQAGVALLIPWPLKFLIDNVLGGQPMPSILARFLGFLPDNPFTLLILVVAAGLWLTLSENGLNVVSGYVTTRLKQGMILDFRSDLFQHTQRQSLAFHDRASAGQLMYTINSLASAAPGLIMAIRPLAKSILTLIGMFWISLQIDPVLALLSLAVVPFFYYSVGYYAKHIRERLRRVRGLEAETLSIIHEAMSMFRVVVAFGRERYEFGRFRDQGERALDARVKLSIRQSLFSLVVDMITAVGTALVLGVGAYHALQGRLSVGELLVVMSYIGSVYKPLESISHTVGSMQEKFIALEMAFGLLDTEPKIQDAQGATPIDRAAGHIVLEGVHFSYDGRVDTLKDISLEAKAGQAVAVVGPTGAGKSTLVSLFPRFYDPQGGRILLDGTDIRQLTVKSLRQQISIVLQEPLLFSGSVNDNIRYGRLDASEADIIEAARAANAHDFIMGLPDQYETRVGERGAQLSAGERQRIAMARAFLKDAPILILDEPTSSIDSKTETVILDALERLMVGRTTFVIAHRLSTIRRADFILVMDHGRVVEQGSEDVLLRDAGLYRQLYEAQSGQGRQSEPAQSIVPTSQAGETRVNLLSAKKIVLFGIMSRMPVAGMVWLTMQHVIGFKRLGYDVYYVEAHARTPSMLMQRREDDSSLLAANLIADTMRRFDLGDRWAFHALHSDGRCYGLSQSQLHDLYRSAALLINLHGGTRPLPEHTATGRLIYLGTDPGKVEIEVYHNVQNTIDFLAAHTAFFTWGGNYGNADYELPISDRFPFRPTRQPVVVDLWQSDGNNQRREFTTVSGWRQREADILFQDEVYHWSKHHQFLKFLEAPKNTNQVFELALSGCSEADKRLLESNGWQVKDGLGLSMDVDAYRQYICTSRGEFTVAKDQYVRPRSGWFSDRSATYLAAGRPVITQETGFSNVLPSGHGLFPFSTLEGIQEAVERINSDYEHHCRAAHELAREYFAHDVVLTRLLADLGA